MQSTNISGDSLHRQDTNGELWLLDESMRLKPVDRFGSEENAVRPIVFIHGANYFDADEVMRDLVLPMLEIIGQPRRENRPIYIFKWQSQFSEGESGLRYAPFRILNDLCHCRSIFRALEARAVKASEVLVHLMSKSEQFQGRGPIVIAHSLGNLVWAHAAKSFMSQQSIMQDPGLWWSLQPALNRHSMLRGGEFEVLPRIYNKDSNGKAFILYSKFDFVLSTLYLISKREMALGQFGCPALEIPQINISGLTFEAHGTNFLFKRMGCFFTRLKAFLVEKIDTNSMWI
ncbi:MAG: hypothetical protein NT027_00850 [Proteobacteria bacterium]|nr:hypothetical protein [Pseudomonadota bacterium]